MYKITNETLIENILRTKNTRIGEISNIATKYSNKVPKDEKSEKYFRDCIDECCCANAVEINSVKTGIKAQIRSKLQKRAGKLPYFMRYAGEYYAKLAKFSYDRSNMNLLCFELERWAERLIWDAEKNTEKFDYSIYVCSEVSATDEELGIVQTALEEYLAYERKIYKLRKKHFELFSQKWINAGLRRVPLYLFEFDEEAKLNKKLDELRGRMLSAIPDKKTIGNCIVETCYKGLSPGAVKKRMRFAWNMGDCLAGNVKPVTHSIPAPAREGEEYLGRKYTWKEYTYTDDSI